MCQFGRPLYVCRGVSYFLLPSPSSASTHSSSPCIHRLRTRYEASSPNIKRDIIEFAKTKIIGGHSGSKSFQSLPPSLKDLAELAVIDNRLSLDFKTRRSRHGHGHGHRGVPTGSVNVQNKLIENNMRVIYSVSREHIISGYPSEPILAEASAAVWSDIIQDSRYKDKDKEKDKDKGETDSDVIAKILLTNMDNGIISKGDRGVAARLLLTLAFDKALVDYRCRQKDHVADADAHTSKSPGGEQAKYSGAVPVEYFFRALLGDTNYEKTAAEKSFSDAFAHGKIRFTHFGRAGDEDGPGPVTSAAAYSAMLRGMAIQCHRGHGMVIPILFDDGGVVSKSKMSGVLVSIAASESSLATFFPNDRPFIAINMELDAPVPKMDFTESGVTICGCSPSVYPVVKDEAIWARLLATCS